MHDCGGRLGDDGDGCIDGSGDGNHRDDDGGGGGCFDGGGSSGGGDGHVWRFMGSYK